MMRPTLLLLCALRLPAQEHTPKRFVQDFLQEEKRIWTSPARMFDRDNLATRTLPLLAGTGLLLAADRRIAGGLPNSHAQIKWGRNISNAGAAALLGSGVAGLLAAGRLRRDPGVEDMGWNGAQALASAAAASFALKFAFGRERPDDNPRGRFYKGKGSFPSGHAMTAWAVAAAVSRSPGCPKWLKWTSYSLASAVSVSRVAAHRHFSADVFAGGMMGALIGGSIARH